jgi:probable addiction module antidote protein
MVDLRPFDASRYLETPEQRASYFEAILEDNDASLIAAGLGDIAKAYGVTAFAKATGISREAIYKGFVPGGNPTIETIAKAAKAPGLRLAVMPTRAKRKRKGIVSPVTGPAASPTISRSRKAG